MTAIIAVFVATSGALFSGGIGGAVGSSMFLVSSGLVAYSQTDYVKTKFRERKAIEKCEDSGQANCTELVKGWSADDLLDYIRDDDPGTATQWSDMAPRLGSPKNAGGI